MSVTGNIIGMPPGAGGSFPMAGTRPKIRKTLMVVSSSIAWTAPPNVYHVILEMVGGGGSGGILTPDICAGGFTTAMCSTATSYLNSWVGGGAGAAAVAPSIVPVFPGATYVLRGGTGGVPASQSFNNPNSPSIPFGSVNGNSGSLSSFSGMNINIVAPGGVGGLLGSGSFVVRLPIPNNSFFGATYVTGAFSPSTGSLMPSSSAVTASTFGRRLVSSSDMLPGSWGSPDQLERACEANLGGNTLTNLQIFTSAFNPAGFLHVMGGGASLYGTGSNGVFSGSFTSQPPPGFGAGSGAACGYSQNGVNRLAFYDGVNTLILNPTNFPGMATSSFGGHGFVRITWEE